MLSIRKIWWIPVIICIILGIVGILPIDTDGDGTLLPYKPIIPLAPISSILIWLLGVLFYFIGRWYTSRPMRMPPR